uniref:NrsF family protein n=1 Tax=Parerythrobacter lutipelagi TaxID=1964208 RepID=UPI0010F8A6E8|nr:DUF1109 domain-containing protein [Parerythrobacter lutipelagi]
MNPERNRRANSLIERLSDDLEPVRAIRTRDGIALVALAVVVTILLVEFTEGLWLAGLTGSASPFFYLGNGLLLVLGAAAAIGVLAMASPRVGNRHEGPKWAMAMAAVLPLAALVTLFSQPGGIAAYHDPYGMHCLTAAVLSSVLVAGALVTWLRRGAPVSVNTAGLLVGVASTALGSAAYGLSCPLDGMLHIGFWHAAPVAIGALVGRFALPPLLRW